jgi:predicted amidohydrolase
MKIALTSIDQHWEDKEKNRDLCLSCVEKAAAAQVDLIIFPEMTLTGFSNKIFDISEDEITSPTINFFSEIAKRHKIAIVFGVVIKEQNKASNRAYFVDNSGSIKISYTKIHPFSMAKEGEFYVAGNSLPFLQYQGLKIGLTICYDLRFPEIYSALAKTTNLIINIANWPKTRLVHWQTLLKARSIENQVFIAGVNRIGIDGNNFSYEESSMIYNPNGEEIHFKKVGEFLKIFTVDKNFTKEFKKKFNTTKDRKISLYQNFYQTK